MNEETPVEVYAVRDEDHIVPNEVIEWHPAWDGTDERRCWRCGFSPAAGVEGQFHDGHSRPICGDCMVRVWGVDNNRSN